jgi:hypothetical protein
MDQGIVASAAEHERLLVTKPAEAVLASAHEAWTPDPAGARDATSVPIETSSITVHADEVSARCFVDVFSCRPSTRTLPPVAVAHFGGTPTVTVLIR